MVAITIDQLRVGRAELFGPNGQLSAINKHPVLQPLKVTQLGLEGDMQADKRVHGGPEKAIHYYPVEHYQTFAEICPDIHMNIGDFGENVSASGLIEQDVCLGDIFTFGTARVQLSQGRQPCWKLNVRFNHRQMAKLVQQNGLIGWYFRVLDEGEVCAGDSMTLLERPYPEANLDKLLNCLHRDTLNIKQMKKFLEVESLPANWRKVFEKRISSGIQESHASRVETPK